MLGSCLRTVPQHTPFHCNGKTAMSLLTILLIVLVLVSIGALPTWPHSRNWGYGPSGGMGLVMLVLIILLLTGRI